MKKIRNSLLALLLCISFSLPGCGGCSDCTGFALCPFTLGFIGVTYNSCFTN